MSSVRAVGGRVRGPGAWQAWTVSLSDGGRQRSALAGERHLAGDQGAISPGRRRPDQDPSELQAAPPG